MLFVSGEGIPRGWVKGVRGAMGKLKSETEFISGINSCCGAVSGTALVRCVESLLV